MRYDEEYRQYQIAYQRGDTVAVIKPPGSLFVLDIFPSASAAEGRSVLREKAIAAIEADLAKPR